MRSKHVTHPVAHSATSSWMQRAPRSPAFVAAARNSLKMLPGASAASQPFIFPSALAAKTSQGPSRLQTVGERKLGRNGEQVCSSNKWGEQRRHASTQPAGSVCRTVWAEEDVVCVCLCAYFRALSDSLIIYSFSGLFNNGNCACENGPILEFECGFVHFYLYADLQDHKTSVTWHDEKELRMKKLWTNPTKY